jgi:pimeloyl-ACP methyl ester carboxylesterase
MSATSRLFRIVAGLTLLRATVAAAQSSDASVPLHDGYVSLDAYRLHTVSGGQGKALVVFESGMGDGASSWEKVQPAVAKLTRTLAYDRAGLGQSGEAPKPLDLNQSAEELHVLLQKSRAQPPYILVGHSMGGLIVRIFAFRYPRDIAGLVLVDPSDEHIDARLHAKLSKRDWDAYRAFMKHHIAQPNMRADKLGMTSSSEAAEADPLPRVPKIVLSAARLDDVSQDNRVFRETMDELHREWVRRTPNAELVAVPTSEHNIQSAAPDAVISAIQRLIVETAGTSADARRGAGPK